MRVLCSIALFCLLATPLAAAELSGNAQANGKPVQYAIVWLDAPGAPAFVQTKKVVLDQRNMDFNPRVLSIRVGTRVDFPNSDKVFHNVFSFRNGKKFNLGMYPAGTSRPIIFDQSGLSRIFCNIHPHMAAYVMAVDTPYFAMSDESGAFTISGVPAGSYTYHAWRPGGQTLTASVTVDSSHALEVRWP
jgi:plastocyanin